jgi:hypothetical protein
MKKFKLVLPAIFALAMTCLSASANDIGTPLTLPSKEALSHMTKDEKQALVVSMKERVEEIKAMDKSHLSREERKALKAELKAMHRESKAITGVYISVGALIIIILLLIIII